MDVDNKLVVRRPGKVRWERLKRKLFRWQTLYRIVWGIVRTVLLIGLAFMIVFPLIIKLSAALKPEIEMYDPTVIFIPKHPSGFNFHKVWTYMNFPTALMKSVILSSFNGVFQVISCTLVAYGLARFRFKGRGIVFAFVILTLIIPPQMILLPLFLQFRSFNPFSALTFNLQSGVNLLNSYWPFFLLSASALGFKNGLYVFMMRQYFKNMPKELEEAGYIDGSGALRTFTRIMLPGALPIMVTVFLFAFVWQWNDTFYTSIFMPNYQPLSTQLSMIGDVITRSEGMIYNQALGLLYSNTAILLHIIPLIVIYLFAQRYFVQSIERSGLVG